MFCDMEGYTSISEKLGPEGVYTRMMEALKRLVLRGSEIRPLIMAFEDLHRMDKASEDLARSILESIPGFRVFLIFTYRLTKGIQRVPIPFTLQDVSRRRMTSPKPYQTS